MFTTRHAPISLIAGAVLLAGCSSDGTFLGSPITTGSIQQAQKVDPACVSLTAEIDSLMKEGVAEKVEKAASSKYRLKKADLAKADRLNKANAEFQDRCALNPTKPAEATAQAGSSDPAGQNVAAASGKTAGDDKSSAPDAKGP